MSAKRRSAGAALQRLLLGVVTVWVLTSLVFLALRLLPGDPAALILGELAGEKARAQLRASLGLDLPLWKQYLRFLWSAAHGDLGQSLRRPGEGALTQVWQVLPATAALSATSVAMGTCGGLLLGVLSLGPWLGRLRKLADGLMATLATVPLLAFAPIATYALAVRLKWVPLPGDPAAGVGGVLFAGGLLALPLGAHVARVTRAAMWDLTRAQFLQVAVAKGAPPWRVWVLHALPAATGPILAVVATQLGALLGGAVVLERLFERPGLGSLMLQAYASRDLPVMQAAIIVSGAMFVGSQTLAASLQVWLDPRAGEAA